MDERESLQKWSSARLAELVKHSKREWWLNIMIPDLEKRGVLKRVGRAWIGRRSAIESALLGGR